MSSPACNPVRYRFGQFELDLAGRCLRKDGVRIKLQPKPYELLLVMLERPGELISRQELHRRLWADGTFVDYEQGLNVAVKKLRDALCDTADQARYIETQSGRGYRWVAKVEVSVPNLPAAEIARNATAERQEQTGESATLIKGTQVEIAPSGWTSWRAIVLGLSVIAVIAAILVARRTFGSRVQPVRAVLALPGDFQLLTTGDNAGIALSPDGSQLAFAAVSDDGRSGLWVRRLDSLQAQELGGTEEGAFPFWSPDGKQIAFFTHTQLKKIDLATNKVTIICDAHSGRGGAWLSATELLFTKGTTEGIYRISADGTNLRPVTSVQAPYTTHRWPEVLPGGKHFIFLAASHSNDSEPAAIMMGSLDGAEPKLLVHTGSAAKLVGNGLLYVSGGKLMYQTLSADEKIRDSAATVVADDVQFDTGTWYGSFAAAHDVLIYWTRPQVPARQVIAWYDPRGKKMADAGPPGIYRDVSLSPDGRLIAASCGDPEINVCIIHQDGTVTRLTDQPMSDFPVWSPDSSTLAYEIHRGAGHFGFAFKRLNGNAPERLFDKDLGSIAWHPDGRHLLMVGKNNKGMIADVSGEQIAASPIKVSASYTGRFSPDGRWLAYVSRESGRPEVYIASYPSGGGVVRISIGGGMAPHWRRDGRELYYLGSAKTIFAAGVELKHGAIKAAAPRALFSVPSIPVQWAPYSFDVNSDGTRFVVNTNLPGSRSDLVLITNWLQ